MLEAARQAVRQQHQRRWAVVFAIAAAPLLLVALVSTGRPTVVALTVIVVGALLSLTAVMRRSHASLWGATVNRQIPEAEFSSELFERDTPNLLEARQVHRVEQRLTRLRDSGALASMLLPRWFPNRLQAFFAGAAAAGALVVANFVLTPSLYWTITVTPPVYTGLDSWQQSEGDLVVPEGSLIQWQLLGARADDARVVIGDDELGPVSDSDDPDSENPWDAQFRADHGMLYQIIGESGSNSGADSGGRFTLEVIPDQPPRLAIAEPSQPVNEFEPQDRPEMSIRLVASDDYALDELTALVTLARGEGESVRFRDLEVPIEIVQNEEDDSSEYDLQLTPEQFELEPGDELYVRFVATDNRQPAQSTRSSALIYRWLRDDAPVQGTLAAIAVDRMPDYFRSQRQIIIDTEALLAELDALDDDEFLRRSQVISADQRALRMRYGQYLGEEESTEIGAVAFDADDHDHGDHGSDHARDVAGGDGHDHGGEDNVIGFGASAESETEALLEPYVHAHDNFMQATIFDEHTRNTLVTALNSMWRAELELGLGQPSDALPHENEALRNLKLVQQAARIYVKRVGFEPPPLDEAKRLSGELDEASGTNRTLDARDDLSDESTRLISGLLAWSLTDSDRLTLDRMLDDDSLPLNVRSELARALDENCRACGQTVAAHLWEQMPTPAPGPVRRPVNLALPLSSND